MKDLKYLFAYITPLTVWYSLTYTGWTSFVTLLFVFGIVPAVEIFLPGTTFNHSAGSEKSRVGNIFFDILLYLNIPILFFLLILYFQGIATSGWMDYIGNSLAIGILIGTIGINVAHEIGHRPEWYHQWMSRLLLMTALYMHFNIEHNKGHHLHVATPEDPASAQKGESFYHFWWKSVKGGYLNAWKINRRDMKRSSASDFSLNNLMLWFHFWQFIFLGGVFYFFGWFAAVSAVFIAITGFTLLELVNYIEHYGLERRQLENGRYEPVEIWHSWNSNHDLGRILLYELTRHSDHHFKSTRKYQVLRHFDKSPQLPFGYPGSVLLALVPSLWFRKIDPLLVS